MHRLVFAIASSLVVVLAWGPRAVLSQFNTITFSSVRQCGNFSVHFSGGKPPSALPLTLTVIPFNSKPIAIVIPNTNWNPSTANGAVVTFLPLTAGTDFVASLDDSYGQGTGLVSDIIRVGDSDDTSCLPSSSVVPQARYKLQDPQDLSQCEPYNVLFDPNVVDIPPRIRAFVPKNFSFFANRTGSASGSATYIMNAARGQQVALMFSDDTGFQQTTGLLNVGGDSQSSSACIPSTSFLTTSTTQSSGSGTQGGLSRATIITIGAVTGAIVGGIALAMIVWVRSERKKNSPKNDKRLEEGNFRHESFFDEKITFVVTGPESPPTMGRQQPAGTTQPLSIDKKKRPSGPLQSLRGDVSRTVKNPPYVDPKIAFDNTPTSPDFIQELPPSVSPKQGGRFSAFSSPFRSSLASLSLMSFGAGPKQPVTRNPLTDATAEQSSHALTNNDGSRSRSNSLSSDDINHILEMATMFTPAIGTELGPMETGGSGRAISTVSTGKSEISALLAQRERFPQAIPPSPGNSDVRGSGEHSQSYMRARSRWVDSLLRTYEGTPSTSRPTNWGNQAQSTPSTATYRDPPQALIPSSPLPPTPLPPSRNSYPLSPTRSEIMDSTVISGLPVVPIDEGQTLEIPTMAPPTAPLQKPPAARIGFNRRRPPS